MKRYWGFVAKEFMHILRDSRTMLVLFGMPLAQIMLFGYAVTNEVREAGIAIYDPAQDDITHEITHELLASGYFRLEQMVAQPEDMEAIFRKGKVKEIISYESGFAEKLLKNGTAQLQVVTDASDPNTGTTLRNYTFGIVGQYQRAHLPAGTKIGGIQPVVQMRYNPQLKGVFTFVPGLITIILMLISAMMTSISIAREKENGTMEVLLTSPMAPAQIILSKVTPYLLLALIDGFGILALGKWVFHVPILGNFYLLSAELGLFVLTSLSLGVLISTVSPNQQVALMLSLAGLMLPSILLSGFLFPIENMPVALQVISNALPARWFIVIVKNIMLKGLGFASIWKETLFLAGFAVFFIGVSIRRFNIRLE